MHTMTSHIHVHVYTVSDTHIHTHTQSHTPRYHSGGDKTHAVRGSNAISAQCARKSLKIDFHGQQWDNRGSDGHRVHHIHGDIELKVLEACSNSTTCPWPSQRLLPTEGTLVPMYKLNMTDEF